MKHKTKHPRYCIPWSSFFDNPPYYEGHIELMRKIIKENGGSNLRMRNQFDWSNQPKVITFSAGVGSLNQIDSELQKQISEWVRVDNVINWK